MTLKKLLIESVIKVTSRLSIINEMSNNIIKSFYNYSYLQFVLPLHFEGFPLAVCTKEITQMLHRRQRRAKGRKYNQCKLQYCMMPDTIKQII